MSIVRSRSFNKLRDLDLGNPIKNPLTLEQVETFPDSDFESKLLNRMNIIRVS